MTKISHICHRLSVVHRVQTLDHCRLDKFSLVFSFCCLTLIAILGAFFLVTKPQKILTSSLNQDPPTLIAILPTEAYNSEPTTVTIIGEGFFTITGTILLLPTVYLDNLPLPNVTFVNSQTLTATVPMDLPGGIYTLTVANPDSQSTSLPSGFTVLLNGDGSLGLWSSTNSMTTARQWHQAVQTGGYLYALGGDDTGFQDGINSVERAPINADGSLDIWQAMTPMTTQRTRFAAIVVDNYIYAIGGWRNGAILSSIERAMINADSSLAPWQSMASMPTNRANHTAVVIGDYVYVIGGTETNNGGIRNVDRVTINADGSLSPWEAVASMTTPRELHATVVVGSYIYAIGGHGTSDEPSAQTSVERAQVNVDGSLGNWEVIASLTKPNCAPEVVAAGGYIYVLGGYDCDNFGLRYNSVEGAKVNPDGSLDPWQAVFSMTTIRLGSAAVRKGNSIYAAGGENDYSQKLSSVEHAKIGGTIPTGHGLSINDGALFTNKVTVTLTIGAEPETAQIQVSNDGGFAGAEWTPYVPIKVWQITQYGDYVIPRVVYIRYKDVRGNISSVYQDDIILDITAPTGFVEVMPGAPNSSLYVREVEATVMRPITISSSDDYAHTVYLPLVLNSFCTLPAGPTNVTLYLQAEDDVSGVADMMISHLPDCECGTWEPYSTVKAWHAPEEATTIYVKFRDNAGNVSEAVTDTVTMSLEWSQPNTLK